MGNFITDTLGKIASNVTQSVISALIVTAVTTYLIVSPGKKNEAKETAAKDSANSTTIAAPVEKPDHAGQAGELGQQSTDTATPENVGAGKNMNAAGMTTPAVVPATEKKVPSAQSQSPVNAAATKAYKELSSPETSAEQKLERTIT